MDTTVNLEGFNICFDNGTVFFDIYPISFFSKTNDLMMAFDVITQRTGKSIESFTISESDKYIHVQLSA